LILEIGYRFRYISDPNRNFEFQFGGAGTSTDKCTEIYTGPSPFSEPETRAIRDYLLQTTINWQVYITVHSYGQYVLIPFSYNTTVFPPDFNEMVYYLTLDNINRGGCPEKSLIYSIHQ
jgi:hypothetical protein